VYPARELRIPSGLKSVYFLKFTCFSTKSATLGPFFVPDVPSPVVFSLPSSFTSDSVVDNKLGSCHPEVSHLLLVEL
jgi:hypothetical protein